MPERHRSLLRRCGTVLTAAGLATVCVALLTRTGPPEVAADIAALPTPSAALPVAEATGSPIPSPRSPEGMGRSVPVRISIPRLGVDAPVLAAGPAPDGSAPVPPYDRPEAVTWYEPGPSPGERGPAVMLGHVDDRTGPAVFYGLARLRPGDRVEVARRDRSAALFTVDAVTRTPKTRFPTARVYGDLPNPGLRLITCGGPFDPVTRSYRDNTIVYAHLAGRHPSAEGLHQVGRHATQPPR